MGVAQNAAAEAEAVDGDEEAEEATGDERVSDEVGGDQVSVNWRELFDAGARAYQRDEVL